MVFRPTGLQGKTPVAVEKLDSHFEVHFSKRLYWLSGGFKPVSGAPLVVTS